MSLFLLVDDVLVVIAQLLRADDMTEYSVRALAGVNRALRELLHRRVLKHARPPTALACVRHVCSTRAAGGASIARTFELLLAEPWRRLDRISPRATIDLGVGTAHCGRMDMFLVIDAALPYSADTHHFYLLFFIGLLLGGLSRSDGMERYWMTMSAFKWLTAWELKHGVRLDAAFFRRRDKDYAPHCFFYLDKGAELDIDLGHYYQTTPSPALAIGISYEMAGSKVRCLRSWRNLRCIDFRWLHSRTDSSYTSSAMSAWLKERHFY